METQTCVWVLSNLWKYNGLCPAKLPILDTLLIDTRSNSGFMWYFTNKNGILKRKSPHKSTIDHIRSHFLQQPVVNALSFTTWEQYQQERNSDPEVATLITENNFSVITRSVFLQYLAHQSLNYRQALQIIRTPLSESSRLCVEIKQFEGKRVIKYWKQYNSEGKVQKVTLTAVNLLRELKVLGEEVVQVLQRNTRSRVISLSLVFMQDDMRNLWLVGSTECVLVEQSPVTPLHGPSKSLDLKSATMTSTMRAKRMEVRKSCAGNFCNFVLRSAKLGNEEVDYDDMLKKVRIAYAGDGNKEVNKIKLGLAVDYLQREKEKLKAANVINTIPYKYVFMGKLLLQDRPTEPPQGTIFELDLRKLYKRAGSPALTITVNSKDPHLHPSRIYDGVKVCERCYDIYNTLRKILVKEPKRLTPTPPPRKKLSMQSESRFRRYATPTQTDYLASSGRKSAKEYYQSPIGKIYRTNINDLLADMRYAQTEFDLRSTKVDLQQFTDVYRNMTQDYRKQYFTRLNANKKIRKSSIVPKSIEHADPEEDIALKFFPSENARKWKLKGRNEMGIESWRKYLQKLRKRKLFCHP